MRARSIGSLFLVPIAQSLRRPGAVVSLTVLWIGSWFAAISFTKSLPASMFTIFMGSLAAPIVITMAMGLIQVLAPMETRGRLLSLFVMVTFGVQPIAAVLLIGLSVENLGTPVAYRINGLLMIVGVATLNLLRPEVRRWELRHEASSGACRRSRQAGQCRKPAIPPWQPIKRQLPTPNPMNRRGASYPGGLSSSEERRRQQAQRDRCLGRAPHTACAKTGRRLRREATGVIQRTIRVLRTLADCFSKAIDGMDSQMGRPQGRVRRTLREARKWDKCCDFVSITTVRSEVHAQRTRSREYRRDSGS